KNLRRGSTPRHLRDVPDRHAAAWVSLGRAALQQTILFRLGTLEILDSHRSSAINAVILQFVVSAFKVSIPANLIADLARGYAGRGTIRRKQQLEIDDVAAGRARYCFRQHFSSLTPGSGAKPHKRIKEMIVTAFSG